MTLLLQTIAVLVVAAGATALLRDGEQPRPTAAAVAAIAVALAGIAFADALWQRGRDLVGQRSEHARLDRAGYLGAGGRILGAREDFLGWVERRVPPRAKVHLSCPKACGGGLDQWITWRLSPREFTDTPARAQWIVFYGGPPSRAAIPADAFSPPVTFAPDFSLARTGP